MRTIELVDGARTDADPTQATVWICPECFDAYDGRPADGECQNAGHARLELVATALRPVAGTGAVLAPVAADGLASPRSAAQDRRRHARQDPRHNYKAA